MSELLLVMACAGSGVLLVPQILQILKRPAFSGQRECAGFLGALAIWCLAYAGELSASDTPTMILWIKLQYLGLAYLPVWLILFTLSYNGLGHYLKPPVVLLSVAFGTVTLLLVWMYPAQTGFYSDLQARPLGGISYLKVSPGPWYWIHVTLFYLGVVLFFATMFRNLWNKGGIYRGQLFWFSLASLVPIIGNVLYLTGNISPSGFDPTCILVAFFAIVIWLGTGKSRLFHLVPYARDQLVDRMQDGLLVADLNGTLVDSNQAAREILQTTGEVSGRSLTDILPAGTHHHDWQGEPRLQLKTPDTEEGRWIEFRMIPLTQRGKESGRLLILRDIHHEKTLELEQEALVEELQEALDNIKRLKGLIPICASCKKIRDDQGYWNQLEHFLQLHSDATFSHGICPDCMQKHYSLPSED
jgi:PAS domain S-box-containing protein